MKGRPISATQRAKFLEQCRKVPNVTLACHIVGMGQRSPYQIAERDPQFKQDMADALAVGAALLLGNLWVDAANGVEEYVISMGRIVADPDDPEGKRPLKIRKRDNALAMRLLQSHLPQYGNAQSDKGGDTIPADLQPDPAPKPDEPDAPSIIE